MSTFRDKELGMGSSITRRDFINGAAAAAAAAMMHGRTAFAQTSAPTGKPYYPPSSTGLRGCHTGAYETAHSLRDGTFWKAAGDPIETGEKYDLVIVGSGISGLSAARYFLQKAGGKAKVLLLENHDDFGGHAKRNEFGADSSLMLGYGGSATINSPRGYSPIAKQLITDLGIPVSDYPKYADKELFPSLGFAPSVFFDQDTFGADQLTADVAAIEQTGTAEQKSAAWKKFLAESPLSPPAKSDLQKLYALKDDVLAGKSDAEKKQYLAKTSYADYLTNNVKLDPQAIAFLQARTHQLYGVGIDAVPAQDAWKLNHPGFDGLKLAPEANPGLSLIAKIDPGAKAWYFHFPDGNASVARLLVRELIPSAAASGPATDIVSAAVRYDQLDQAANNVRIRLGSTAVRIKHIGGIAAAKEVEAVYVKDGKLHRVTAAHGIFACWNEVIPFLTEEISQPQRDALTLNEKIPSLRVNVALTNWHAFAKAQTASIHSPGAYFSAIELEERLTMGGYSTAKSPDQPTVVTLFRTPCTAGLPARSQHKAGRAEIYNTDFETYERNIRDQLARALGPSGFDPAKDITAITVNRWGHGRTYPYNSLWDPFLLAGGTLPYEAARAPYGRIAIANADAGGYGFLDSAVDQAYRAVNELKL